MDVSTESIRNVAVAGHGSTGKTTLVENLLFSGGAIPKAEPVESGKSVSDYTDEEVEYGHSIHTTVSHLTWREKKINLLDTPGTGDFVGEVVAAFRACESAVLLVDAKAGIQIETLKLVRRLDHREMPRIVFVNKMDEDQANFQNTLADLQERFTTTVVPITMPMGAAGDYAGVINLIDMKAYPVPGSGSPEKSSDIPETYRTAAEEMRAQLVEAAAEGDDDLLTKYLEEESLSEEEIRHGLNEGLQGNKIVPVMCGASALNSGTAALLDVIAESAPSPAGISETAVDADGNETPVQISADDSFSALCFKTTIDQFSGKLSYVKVITGKLSNDTELFNAREGKKEKTSKIHTTTGKKLEDVGTLVAGDIGVLVKVASTLTNDSLCTPDRVIRHKPLQLPQPVHSLAISVSDRKDEDKLADVLHRAVEEDLTFRVEFNEETKETVISGMGELHLSIVMKRIRDQQKIELETKVPRVAYRETITKPAEANYRHKKQSGGHGQFGEVYIKIQPLERGQFYQFDNAIRGMAVSKGYIPGIEKGLHEAMEEGVVAGYPMVDIGTTLLDGKEHSVDSSEMAFKMAAKGALKEAMSKAGPTLLEPVMHLFVFIEEQYLGDVLSDITSRRGRVLGQEQLGGGIVEIKAQVPQAELLRYSIDLRSITSGTGSFEMEFNHYSPISGRIADDIVKQAQEEKAAQHA